MSEGVEAGRRAAGGEVDDLMDTDGQQQQQATASQTTHSLDLEAFAQRFSQIPVVVAYVFSFLSLHLVAALPQRLWGHVGCQITQLVMDTHDTAERRFWYGLSFADAFEWGRRLTRLITIVVKLPSEFRILSLVIEKTVTALVEGHSEGRRGAAATATGQQGPTTLESIDISKCSKWTITIDEDENRVIRAAEREALEALPPPLNPPPTLTSLRSITGIPFGIYEFSYPGRGRHWQLPSLEMVQVVGRVGSWVFGGPGVGSEMLGGLVATSRRLKQLQVECLPNTMAGSLMRFPTAAACQPGPLSQLEDIGTLSLSSWEAAGLGDLQEVHVDRGCRSIKKLSIELDEYCIDRSIFETLSAIETFTRAVCVSPDIPDINKINCFELSLLCEVPTRPEPSPFVQRHIQQMTATAHIVSFTIRPHHLTTPLDTPIPAAVALAQCLTFSKATVVNVVDQDDDLEYDDWEPDADADQPDPVVIDSMSHNAFPAASRLRCSSRKGLAIGRRLVTKMPAVKNIDLLGRTEEQAVEVLQALGRERELECFNAECVTDVGEGGLTWGDMADQLPTIKRLVVGVEVPEDLGDGDAAGEFGIACVRSLLKIRCIEVLKFQPVPSHAFKRLVEERTQGDTIEGLEGWYDISFGGYLGDSLTLKRLGT
ncbi:unnamed protein product [Vitrella brassicaformis CCMP3155]|uniref:Uncharacterized protein n=1 Tax=Vitrella brassicaformis (strain CCMP3155) TaxID=1169540 RepID=A0A0G4FHY7_VITBC|nr:unnamed protein product [Vitrella brassicaformis CCMP3155]|eukprot:CEM13088.1 unnamed protein product [Vitrella brassicaformis CCMP3155]